MNNPPKPILSTALFIFSAAVLAFVLAWHALGKTGAFGIVTPWEWFRKTASEEAGIPPIPRP